MHKLWRYPQNLIFFLGCFFWMMSQESQGDELQNQPIHIESNEMNYDLKQDVAEAVGSAWAIQGDKKIEADRFVVKFQKKTSMSSPESASKEVREILASGNVRMISPTEEITGSTATYDLGTEILTMYGEKITLISPKGSVFADKSLSYDQKNQHVEALGNVVVHSQEYEMRAPKMGVDFKKTPQIQGVHPQESMALDTLKAEGGVFLKTAKYVSESNEADYSAHTGVVDLVGNVKITDGQNIFEGPCGEYNEKTGKSSLVACGAQKSIKIDEISSKGRVKAILYTTKK